MADERKFGIKFLDTVTTKRNEKLSKLHRYIEAKWNKFKVWAAATNKIAVPSSEHKLPVLRRRPAEQCVRFQSAIKQFLNRKQ
jgi:hypothetical protein